jgi:two-component system LytT family response regulator
MMMTTVIIDDEEGARKTLTNFLNDYCPTISILAEADGVKAGVEAIAKHNPDFILLDIKMRDGTGFDLLRSIDSATKVILTTAYDEFAIKAFRFNAIDYLLKPINPEELIEAVNKLDTSDSLSEEHISSLMNSLGQQEVEKIVLPSLEEYHFVPVKDIVRCEASANYTHFYLINKKRITVANTLKEYEELLPATNFFRTHQSHLVNLNHLKRFVKTDGGYLVMTDDAEVPLSRRKKTQFYDKLSIKSK